MMIDASDEEARLRVSDKVPASSGGFFFDMEASSSSRGVSTTEKSFIAVYFPSD